jgi:hypothetical protein
MVIGLNPNMDLFIYLVFGKEKEPDMYGYRDIGKEYKLN